MDSCYCEVRPVASITLDEMDRMYEFSNSLMEEKVETFFNHVRTQDVFYVFRRTVDKEIVGLSGWDTKETSDPYTKVILQGKLRIRKDFRRKGLHVQAQLFYFLRQKMRHPFCSFIFLSVASLFNFVSMKRSTKKYWILKGLEHAPPEDVNQLKLTYEILDWVVTSDKFDYEEDGMINVKVHISKSTLEEYPDSFYELPDAKEYIAVNPKYREGRDLAYAFPFDFQNVCSMTWRLLNQRYPWTNIWSYWSKPKSA
eukprot:TRINITY_DN556_c0_g1_i1.p1 TRINITY_DN556_c0_g1~~TRINITY_DN556_c0_g1_i1.p1  ORF type:complete len:255 (+),score=43.72 TRINITY_DN556_c0_g1_i1:113-877(+)